MRLRPGAAPASPRSWCTSSTTWPSADAPSGSPFDSRPPLGSRRPAARRASSPARPARTAAAPGTRAARVRRRCPGTRRRRGRRARRPASSYASRAASVDGGVMSVSSMPDSGVASPSTLPGRCERSRADASVHAAARRAATRPRPRPRSGEHSIQRCSGSHTTRDAEHLLGRHLGCGTSRSGCARRCAGSSRRPRRGVPSSAPPRAAGAARAARSTRAWPRARLPRATARRTTSG